MSDKKAAILVTGGTGNIGTWVTRRLVGDGFLPVVYDLKPDLTYLKDISDKILVVAADVTDFGKLDETIKRNKVEQVIHLAKLLGPPCENNPRRAAEVNVMGSANVIDAARINGIQRVVFSSSKSVYASITGKHAPPELVPVTEDWPKFNRQESDYVPFYSTTNKMVEYFGIRMAMKYNMEFVILRFGNVWGPGKMAAQLKYQQPERYTMAYVVSKMIDDTIAGQSTSLPAGGSPLDIDDFVYNKDVAQGVVKACLSDKIKFEDNHREIHFDAGRAFIISDFASVLMARFPAVSIQLENKPLHLHRPGIKCVFNISRASEELGYEPDYAELEKAVADYIETEKIFKGSAL